MPRIFDNINQDLLPVLKHTLEHATHADFCVGYFNLRGWKGLAAHIENLQGGEGACCRVLIGMQKPPEEIFRYSRQIDKHGGAMDNQTAYRLKQELAEDFRKQLTVGVPTREDEIYLRQLVQQLRDEKVKVKLFLKHPLHAKLYLLYRHDQISPTVGYLGSSNLTLAGLSQQGELNIDVVDKDTCDKLEEWFEDRWNERLCADISKELIDIIEQSWAREALISPYHIYIKMAYHLSREARAGLTEFRIPREFQDTLFDFQTAAVKIAAHHLNKRGGVLIGDVVGLGKTLMGTALARIYEDDHGVKTLIICPKNLVSMWEHYRAEYGLRGDVLSLSQVLNRLPELRRYGLIMIDESHNLRNRESKRYGVIQDYIRENDSKVILLSATPYNKTYHDLSNQLRLFVHENQDLGIRPEQYIKEIGGETEFIRRHQSGVRTIAALEQSDNIDDWRELMRRYLVRRTRSFIMENYAETDIDTKRKYLMFADGKRSYFPTRVPKTLKFSIDDKNPDDTYAQLYSDSVVNVINNLILSRYGLANYIINKLPDTLTKGEEEIIDNLSRAGQRLKGFCRTNLFKRLESSGMAFIQSVDRHILRNYIFLHAIENNKPIPIGSQNAEMLDSRFNDGDVDDSNVISDLDGDDELINDDGCTKNTSYTPETYEQRATGVYHLYTTKYKNRFKWISPNVFDARLREALSYDVSALMNILQKYGTWDADKDAKLNALEKLLTLTHENEKVLVFTQFADTVQYVTETLIERGIRQISQATGSSDDPTKVVMRFSPISNNKTGDVSSENELRILISTDVLSEGQNLQDCSIVVNYDLPWAIVRLVQRAGRVDRIGQEAENIICYSFLPAEGVDRIIKLRQRVRERLKQGADVIGTDEAFFEDDGEVGNQKVADLYNEKAGLLDDEVDNDVDLSSYAYQIWENAIAENPSLKKIISDLPAVVYSTQQHVPKDTAPDGTLVYIRTAQDNDALAWIDKNGQSITESQFAILQAAACEPDTTPLPPLENHHELVQKAAKLILSEEQSVGGQLGSPRGARFKTYERLKQHADDIKDTLFYTQALEKAIAAIYRSPLQRKATETLNRQLRSGISNENLAESVINLWETYDLCIAEEEQQTREPQIVCSLGLRTNQMEVTDENK